MKHAIVVLVLLFLYAVLASLPTKQTLRYKQVTGNHLGANSVDFNALQEFALGTNNVQNQAITNSKLAPISITADEVAPGAVNANGVAVDLVRLIIRDGTVHAASQDPQVRLPNDVTSIKPWEFSANVQDTSRLADYPDVALSYRVEGKAKGPGVILGWYPNVNGHLLRYQSSRAVRGLVCADIALLSDIINVGDGEDADYNYDIGDGHGVIITREDNWQSDLSINNGIPQAPCSGFCSSLSGCGNFPPPPPNLYTGDVHCNVYDPLPLQDFTPNSPDRCGRYTNVQDVRNPQEGTPVYSPSVERITIDDTGLVEMWFFGRGSSLPGTNINIDVTVVVLLFGQYGASSQF